jgi:parallel beta-helix repeat protein
MRLNSRNDVVQGNIIGLDMTGTAVVANEMGGIQCNTSSGSITIAGNIVSGNRGHGVHLLSRNNVVRGNIIGLDVTGSLARPNALDGIRCDVNSDNTVIANNTVSGNLRHGLMSLSPNNVVQGNIIGLNMAGNATVANGEDGIGCDSGSDNTSNT